MMNKIKVCGIFTILLMLMVKSNQVVSTKVGRVSSQCLRECNSEWERCVASIGKPRVWVPDECGNALVACGQLCTTG